MPYSRPRRRPAAANASTAQSMSAAVSSADTEMRIRAAPRATVGYLTGRANTPGGVQLPPKADGRPLAADHHRHDVGRARPGAAAAAAPQAPRAQPESRPEETLPEAPRVGQEAAAAPFPVPGRVQAAGRMQRHGGGQCRRVDKGARRVDEQVDDVGGGGHVPAERPEALAEAARVHVDHGLHPEFRRPCRGRPRP